eukprot:598296-Prymnesium_polylepis.1
MACRTVKTATKKAAEVPSEIQTICSSLRFVSACGVNEPEPEAKYPSASSIQQRQGLHAMDLIYECRRPSGL